MDSDLKKVMLESLEEAQGAFAAIDSNKLKSISDYTLHYAGIFQDSYSVSVAIIIYSLAKIVEKKKIRSDKDWTRFKAETLRNLKEAKAALEKEKLDIYLAELKELLASIGKIDATFGTYVTEAIEKAKIKKGFAVYAHGLSVGRAAELMGVSPWELMDYLGQTKLVDEMPMLTKPISDRLAAARKIFNMQD
ncbi:MAG: hypothetical protein PHO02_03075 [Candidatus Nanoarchaeia archaeon]|nr:hypothetical protein [Candidatus Nanoarchaeia archaeon]